MEGSRLKSMSKKNKILILVIILCIAGLFDIKYKGLFFRSLPKAIQSFLS